MYKKENSLLIALYLILFVLVVFRPPLPVSACSCDVPDDAMEALEEAAAVFKGKVIKLKEETIDREKYDVALISVSEVWKGNIDSQVIVYTEGSSCQFVFEEEKEYLLYPSNYNGKFEVINCGRNAETKYAEEDLLELGKGTKPTNMVQLEDNFENRNSLGMISVALLIIVVSVFVYLRRKKKLSRY